MVIHCMCADRTTGQTIETRHSVQTTAVIRAAATAHGQTYATENIVHTVGIPSYGKQNGILLVEQTHRDLSTMVVIGMTAFCSHLIHICLNSAPVLRARF
jgi:hypothetical protein